MFHAMILFCALSNPNSCVVADDMYGPYKTREECVARTTEMISAVASIVPEPQTYKFKCVDDAPKVST